MSNSSEQQDPTESSGNQAPITTFPILNDERLNKLADTALGKMARQLQGELLGM
jgi:hypothetical protein